MGDAWAEERRAEMRGIAGLVPHASNARTHSADQVKKIAESIKQFGFVNPVLIDEAGGIIAGHGRVLAAHMLGLREVPCLEIAWLSPEQKRAYVLADNRLAELSGWDFSLVEAELTALEEWGFDTSVIGFSESDFAKGGGGLGGSAGSLSDRFGVPPFSVLNAREGWWQSRKAAWIALGIQSELGRGENLIGRSPQELFCHVTGIPYDRARQIVSEAMEKEGDAFDLQALIREHGGKRSNFARSGAVMAVGQPGGLKENLLEARGYKGKMKGSLGALPPNEKTILNAKKGSYAKRKAK